MAKAIEQQLSQWWPKIFGYHLLKIGSLSSALDTSACNIKHQIKLNEQQEQASVVADPDALPFLELSIDAVLLAHCLEFYPDPHHIVREAHRVLKPGGVMAFASLCVGTLSELRDSWRAVDGQVHVNRFREFATYQQLCADSSMRVLDLQSQPHVLHYAQVRQLTHELKALGAHNLNPGRPEGLTGRARLQALVSAYEQFRQPQGLPATYQVVYGILEKTR